MDMRGGLIVISYSTLNTVPGRWSFSSHSNSLYNTIIIVTVMKQKQTCIMRHMYPTKTHNRLVHPVLLLTKKHVASTGQVKLPLRFVRCLSPITFTYKISMYSLATIHCPCNAMPLQRFYARHFRTWHVSAPSLHVPKSPEWLQTIPKHVISGSLCVTEQLQSRHVCSPQRTHHSFAQFQLRRVVWSQTVHEWVSTVRSSSHVHTTVAG